MCFSGGKDSCLALRALQRDGEYRVKTLITTVTDAYDRVSMHGVRRSLLREQAASLGIGLVEVAVPPKSSNEVYERAMGREFDRQYAAGIRRVAFGDIFLEDLREYRECRLAQRGLEAVFPLWGQPTDRLARSFIDDGFEAVTVCVSLSMLSASFAGREFDKAFLADLPRDADPMWRKRRIPHLRERRTHPRRRRAGRSRRGGGAGRFRLLRPGRGRTGSAPPHLLEDTKVGANVVPFAAGTSTAVFVRCGCHPATSRGKLQPARRAATQPGDRSSHRESHRECPLRMPLRASECSICPGFFPVRS